MNRHPHHGSPAASASEVDGLNYADRMPWMWARRYATHAVLLWTLALLPTNVLFALALVGIAGVATTAAGGGSLLEVAITAALTAPVSLALLIAVQTVALHRAVLGRRLWWLRTDDGWAACHGRQRPDGWELSLLLAVPRSRGIGSRLGREILADADRDDDVLYLQARTRALERWYASQGFVTVRRTVRAQMLRTPRS